MSDVNAETGEKPEVEGEQGNANAPLTGTVSDSKVSEDSSDATSADAAANGENLSGGDNPYAGDTITVVPGSSPATASAVELPNDVLTSRVALATPAAMVSRVEAAALQAYQSSNTDEHNLMAWLHTHLTGARAAAAGADGLEGLSPEAQSILADLKNLL